MGRIRAEKNRPLVYALGHLLTRISPRFEGQDDGRSGDHSGGRSGLALCCRADTFKGLERGVLGRIQEVTHEFRFSLIFAYSGI